VFRERLVDKFWKFMAHLLMRKGFLIRKSLRGLWDEYEIDPLIRRVF
jgi:hypothetical protein